MNWVTAVSSIFVLVGAAMLIAAGREFARRRAFLRNSDTVSGTIIALTENRERDRDQLFFEGRVPHAFGPRHHVPVRDGQ